MALLIQQLRSGMVAFEERNFRFLFLGRVISSIGDRITPIALAFAVLEINESAALLGIVLSARTIAMIVSLLLGGVWADRLPRRHVLIGTDLVRFGSQGLTALLLITGQANIPVLVILQAISGAGQGFFRPAATGMVPDTVRPQYLQQSNALLSIAEDMTTIVGATIASVLIATIGSGWAIAVDAASFGLSALFLARIQLAERRTHDSPSILTDLKVGWDAFFSRRWLVSMVLQFSVYHVAIWAPLFVLGPLIAKQNLGGASTWALMMTAYGIGTILGSGMGLRIRSQRPFVVVSLLFIPQVLPLIGLATSTQVVILCLAMLLSGVASGYLNVLWDTGLQRLIPPAVLSRVSSYDWFASMVFLPVGYAIVGPVSSWLGNAHTLWIAAGVQVVVSLCLLLVVSRRAIWEVRF